MKREKQLNAKNVELKKYKEEQPLKLGESIKYFV